jgi:hypothetical protein
MAAALLADYQKACADLSVAIFKWADPAGAMVKTPTRTWPLAGLDVALAIAAFYLVVVFVGSVRFRNVVCREEGNEESMKR